MAKIISLTSTKNKLKSKSSKPKSRLEIAKENLLKQKQKMSKTFSSKRKIDVKSTGKSRWKRRLVQISLVGLSVFIFVGAIATVWAISYLQTLDEELPSLDAPFGKRPEVTRIFARDIPCNNDGCDFEAGTQLYRVFDKFNADPVDINQIPEYVKWSFLAAEDNDFYTHPGFDVRGIINCGIANIRAGETACGGSTVTQQLLKLTVFSNEPPIERKIKELLMATKIEQAYEKDEILQMYLTVTGFGSSVTGVVTAADFYFDKEPKDLTLAESTILAAIIQDPNGLSPTVPSTFYFDADNGVWATRPLEEVIPQARERLVGRQQYILDQMEDKLDKINNQIKANKGDAYNEETDAITIEKIEAARIEEIKYQPPIATDIKAGHFVDYVMTELTTKNFKNGTEPFTREELNVGGYKVVTSLDYQQQLAAERAVANGGNNFTTHGVNNAALMTINPQNGEILSMAGSKSYFGQSSGCNANGEECVYDPQVNVLTSFNEPGSTAKSLGYTLAFEDGKLFGGSNLPDIPIAYPELNYEPKNWNGAFAGQVMTARTALVNSLNIPALQVIELIGLNRYLDTMQNLGYTTINRANVGPSAMLGGISVKYTEHVNAYAAFANGGFYIPINPILKIYDRDGKEVYSAGNVEKKQVFSDQAAFILWDILYNLQNIANESNWAMACKTGTTENNIEALQVCWNKSQVTIAWAGNNNNAPLSPATGYPIYAVQPWISPYFREIKDMAYFSDKPAPLDVPGFLLRGDGCSSSDASCASAASDWFISGKNAPTYIQKGRFTVCSDQQNRLARDIDRTLGLATDVDVIRYIMPAARWQQTLDENIAFKGGQNTFPTEQCNLDRNLDNRGPNLNITSPSGSISFTNSIQITGSAIPIVGTISSVVFYLNGQQIGTANSFANINQTVNVPNTFDEGVHILEIIATDSRGKTSTKSFTLTKGDGQSNSFIFTLPASPLAFGSAVGGGISQPISVSYSFGASSVNLFQVNNTTGAVTNLGAMSGSGNNFTYSWGSTIAAGSYSFYVTANPLSGGSTESTRSATVVVQ